jgi:hypothetical protein
VLVLVNRLEPLVPGPEPKLPHLPNEALIGCETLKSDFFFVIARFNYSWYDNPLWDNLAAFVQIKQQREPNVLIPSALLTQAIPPTTRNR